jgi:hypothetical protein
MRCHCPAKTFRQARHPRLLADFASFVGAGI